MTMDYIRSPAKFFYCFQNTPGVEYGTLIVIVEKFIVFIVESIFALEIIFIINKINLHPGLLN